MNHTTNIEANNNTQVLTNDVEIVQTLAKTLIQRLARIVNSAEKGEASLELASKTTNDIISINLDLPENSNYEVTCVIKDKNTVTAENLIIPVVTLTARAKNIKQKNATDKNHMINCLLNSLNQNNLKMALKYFFK